MRRASSFCAGVLFVGSIFGGSAAFADSGLEQHKLNVTGKCPTEIHYVTAGSKDKEAVVLIHGFPESSYMWKKHMALLSEKYFVIAPDLRGYGDSGKPADVDAYKLDCVAEDIRQLITKSVGENKKAVVVGHDWGGLVAHSVALLHPDVVKKLVVINAPHPKALENQIATNEKQRRALDYIIGLRKQDSEKILEANNHAALKTAFFEYDPDQKIFTPEDREAYEKAWTLEALRGGLNYYRAAQLGPTDFWDKYTKGTAAFPIVANYLPQATSYKLTMPVMYIWGLKDKYLLPELTNGMANYATDCTVVPIPEGTHWTPSEFPESISKLISTFAETKN